MAEPAPAFEVRDVDPRRIACLGLAAAAALVAATLILGWAYGFADAAKGPPGALPEPRQQVDPAADLRAVRAAEDRRLSSYGWVDRAHGIAHVPIATVMARFARDGIPGWPGQAR